MSSDEEWTDSSSSEQEEIPPPPPPPQSEPALDGERQLVLDTSSGDSLLAPPSNRIWQEPMQLLLLREMVDYSEINGKCKVSLSYASKFHSSLEGSPLLKFSANQILEKMKRLKRMYDNLYEKGERKRKGKPLHPELLELSRKLWGEAGKDKGKKRKRVKVEVVENGGDDDVVDDDDDDDGGDIYFRERKVWAKAMARLMKEYYYQEDYTRYKIASLDQSTRDLLVRRWLNLKGKLNTAIVNFGRVESECLQALLPS